MRRGTRIAAALVLGAAACSNGHAGSLPTPTPTATSPSPSPTPTSRDFGVGQAVRDYYRALEAAVHDPRSGVDDVAARLDSACSCRQIVDVLRQEGQAGRHADYTLSVGSLGVSDASPAAGTAFVTVTQSSGRLYDSSGKVIEAIKGRTDQYVVDLRSRDGRWVIVRISER